MTRNGSSGAPRHAEPRTVLVVEDEDEVRSMILRILQADGFRVLEAQNGATALRVLAELEDEGVELVLTDLRMPVMDGRELAAALARLRPSLPIVFMSGFTAQLMDLRLICPGLTVLTKPFRNADLLATVRGQLERSA